jgi:uncharacterized protein DUF6493
MADVWAEIERAVEAGEPERVADLCLALDESERARHADAVRALFARWGGGSWMQPVARAAQTAVFGLGPPLPHGGFDQYVPPEDRLEALVRARPRDWRDAWARWAVRRGHWHRFVTWSVLRSLIRDGQCHKPAGDDYTQLMLNALAEAPDATEALRADPDDAWAPFHASLDVLRWGPFDAWQSAMVALTAEGTFPRDRLIDETLRTLGDVTDAGVAKWLMTFHDRQIVPTADELAARLEIYLRWLESQRDAMIGFALVHLLRLDRAHAIDGRLLLERLPRAVATPARTHAKRAVTLVGRVLDRAPELASDGRDLLNLALGHSAVDVQEAAFKLYERHELAVPPELVASLDPGLRMRLPGQAASDAVAVAVPPPSLLDPPRLLAANEITPVADVEELLALAAVLVERPDDPDELERFADGLSRLCDEPVDAGRRRALLQRARPKAAVVAAYVEPMVCAWLAPDERRYSVGWAGPTDALGRRLSALMDRVRERRADVLLSAPTHRGGFLDPEVLRARLDRAHTVEDNDLAQAMLRLPRSETVSLARWSEAEMPASHDSARIIAAPDSIDPEPPPEGDAVHGMSYEPGAPASPARLLMSWEGVFALAAAAGVPNQRWLSLVWPDRREHYFTFVWNSVWDSHHEVVRRDRLDAALLTMLEPDEPLGPLALRLLALGLHQSTGTGFLATDVVVEAIATRRLPVEPLAHELVASLSWRTATPNRLRASLASAAEAGPLHAHEVQRMLEVMLGALDEPSSQIDGLVDLLRWLAQDANARVEDPAARAFLESFSPRSKTGKLAAAALAVEGTGAARSIEAAAAVGEAERERTLRWGSR